MTALTTYKWELRNFSTMASRVDPMRVLESDIFTLVDSNLKFCLRFNPTNTKEGGSREYSSLYLMLKDLAGEASVKLDYKLWLENSDGRIAVMSEMVPHEFTQVNERWGWSEFVRHNTLYSPGNTFVIDDTVFLCCDVRVLSPIANENNSTLVAEMQKKEWSLYKEGFTGSCTIKVSGEEFEINKKKLMANSPVFERMFKSGMQEAQTGAIDMKDTTPATIKAFVQYLHLHSLGGIGGDAFELYRLADEYGVSDLKAKAARILIDDLDEDNIFDLMVLASRHDDSTFKEGVVDYLIGHPESLNQIMESDVWFEHWTLDYVMMTDLLRTMERE